MNPFTGADSKKRGVEMKVKLFKETVLAYISSLQETVLRIHVSLSP